MTIEKVNYQCVFPTFSFANEKIGFEASISGGESPIDAVIKLKEIAEDAHRKSNPHLYPLGNEPIISTFEPPVQQVAKTTEEKIEDGIKSCNDKSILITYKLLVKGKPELQKLYDKKFAEL